MKEGGVERRGSSLALSKEEDWMVLVRKNIFRYKKFFPSPLGGDRGGPMKKAAPVFWNGFHLKVGGDLLSRFYTVPSALTGLTSLFGMGRGGTLLLKPP